MLPVRQARDAANRLTHGNIDVLPQCGHLPQLERAELFVTALDRFTQATGRFAGPAGGHQHVMTGPDNEPEADSVPIDALEERPEVVDAIEDDVTVPGLPVPERVDDNPRFQPPEPADEEPAAP